MAVPQKLFGLRSEALPEMVDLPLNGLGQIVSRRIEGEKRINPKECLKALEVAARLYTLKFNRPEVSTFGRLYSLFRKMRFSAQRSAHKGIRRVEDTLIKNRF